MKQATLSDRDFILRMLLDFNYKYHDVSVNMGKAIGMVEHIIQNGVCFVTDGGFIGGTVVDDLYRDWTILQEMGWFATDRSGIALLKIFIDTGYDLRVDEVRIGTLSSSSPAIGRLLRRKGFAPLESSYRLVTGAG